MKVIIRLVLVGLFLGGGFLFRDHLTGGAGDLKLGDCFDVPTTAAETVEEVQHHPCSEAHTGEVFRLTSHPAAKGVPVQTADAMLNWLADTCGAALLDYTDAALDNLDIGAFYPTDADWEKGDREVICYLTMLDGSAITTSLKGS